MTVQDYKRNGSYLVLFELKRPARLSLKTSSGFCIEQLRFVLYWLYTSVYIVAEVLQ
jgi:hypothetical protein